MKNATAITVVIICAAVLTSCSSTRTLDPLDGTRPIGLPPLPPDLAPRLYSVDVFIGSGCAQVPSGLRNCQEILRREAARKLIQRLEQDVNAQFEDRVLTEVGGEANGFREDAVYLSQVTSTYAGHLSLRDHESPIFHLESADAYALRVALVREEVDFYLWAEIAEQAGTGGRESIAAVFSTMAQERYGANAPDRSRIRSVEEDLFRHFTTMWKKSDHGREEG